MKKLAVAWLVTVVLTLVGCGMNNHGQGNINGTWTAVLTGDENFTFGTSFVVNNDGTLGVSQFNFSTSGPCFVSGETASGSFGFAGDFNGNVTGTFGYKVVSGSPSGNTLMLTGTVNGNTIAGNWSLTGGSGCTGSGLFTMTR